MSNRIALRDRALVIAQRFVGVREERKNSGPDIDRWLSWVGLQPGQPWCMAFVHGMYKMAAMELGPTESPWPATGSVWRCWNTVPDLWKSDRSSQGAVFVHITTENTGHCGFVVGVDGDDYLTVEGNTNEEGSREGDGVYQKRRPKDYVDGFIDVGREGPA
jgi:hypothetical protein